VKLEHEPVVNWLVARISGMVGVPAQQIDCAAPFADAGLSSLQAVELAGDLERWAALQLSPTVVFDYPTIEAVAAHVVERAALAERERSDDQLVTPAVEAGEAEIGGRR
jgi:acyl carrier protein